ncbi:nitrile hydratase accessory protein [Cryobacterium sp. Y50]|uniref:nitrile hydratase accessory protein n=1 Tax=Cryobacterium sp. Y50 TaxID=2048286 RepID=UPI000CE31562|nr:nitrile hydratase accessory protein [Cryobacterium sp. Y50]
MIRSDLGIVPLDGIAAIPRDNGEIIFNEPWEATAFGVAVTLTNQGSFTWESFRQQLIKAIEASNGCEAYYESWSKALHASVINARLLPEDEIEELAAELRHPH